MAPQVLCLVHDLLDVCAPIVQEPLLFYRCVFDGLEWQRSMYGHVATRAVLQGFLDSHLTSAAQLLVQSLCSLGASPSLAVCVVTLSSRHHGTTIMLMLEDLGLPEL